MSAKIEPTQADREAYIEWSGGIPERDRQTILAGEWDATTGMQILARHAQAARAEGYEQAIREAAELCSVYSSIHAEKRDDLLQAPGDPKYSNATAALTKARQAQTCDELQAAILKLLENRE